MTIIIMEDQGTIMVIMVEPGNRIIPSLELLWQRSHSHSHLTIVLIEVRDIMERRTIPLTSIYDYYIFCYIIFLIILISLRFNIGILYIIFVIKKLINSLIKKLICDFHHFAIILCALNCILSIFISLKHFYIPYYFWIH